MVSYAGFKTAHDLINYCESHCETPRALFHSSQVNMMLKLAGNPDSYVKTVPDGSWHSLHETMQTLCDIAREKISNNAMNATLN